MKKLFNFIWSKKQTETEVPKWTFEKMDQSLAVTDTTRHTDQERL